MSVINYLVTWIRPDENAKTSVLYHSRTQFTYRRELYVKTHMWVKENKTGANISAIHFNSYIMKYIIFH